MKKTLIIEKKKSGNSIDLEEILKTNVIVEEFENETIENILKKYEKAEIERIIFHASGRSGIDSIKASNYLEKILKWKDNNIVLFAVSEGSLHRTKMEEKIKEKNAQKSIVDSYNAYVSALKDELKGGA